MECLAECVQNKIADAAWLTSLDSKNIRLKSRKQQPD